MGWKFWQKKQAAVEAVNGKANRANRPRDLPDEVGRHLVVEQGLDPDWIWNLKCVRQPRDNTKRLYDIRIFSPETALNCGVKVRDYASLDNHMDMVIFAGWYEKDSPSLHLERLVKEAV